jgi:superfamily II DNA or RNA helicase
MKKKCTLRILDEVNCVFVGLAKIDVDALYEKYAILADNYFFNPKYKLGSWDGRINFFSKLGKTYVNLLSDIIPRVVNFGYHIDVVDLRRSYNVTPKLIDENYFKDRGVKHPLSGEPWVFRDYQVRLINALLKNNGGIGLAGTGAGKTACTAAIALSYEATANLRSIIIVPDKNLTDQTFTNYENFGMDVGQYGGGVKDGDHQHVVSTWQTLQNHPTFIQQFQVIIVDEAHGLKGPVLQKLLNKYGKDIPFRFGVTGTLPKSKCDLMSVNVSVGFTQCEIPAYELQEEGHLADLQINIMQTMIDFSTEYSEYLEEYEGEKPMTYKQFIDAFFPDYVSEKRFLQSDKKRTQWIANYMETQHTLGLGNILCLVNGVAFGRKLAKLIPGAIFLSGKDKVKDRKKAYELFNERDDVTLIATVNIASTGLDIPRIFQMIGIDMGKSFVRSIQSIGRGLRKASDKDSVTYTDICANLKYSRRHLNERKKYYKEAKYKFKQYEVEIKNN